MKLETRFKPLVIAVPHPWSISNTLTVPHRGSKLQCLVSSPSLKAETIEPSSGLEK
jgi:hypothetical protein